MDVSFGDKSLDDLEANPDAKSSYAGAIVKAYRKVMNLIRAAGDERDLYVHGGLEFKKLKGDRAGQHSLRLNDQWRLVVEIRKGDPKNSIHVLRIEDYH